MITLIKADILDLELRFITRRQKVYHFKQDPLKNENLQKLLLNYGITDGNSYKIMEIQKFMLKKGLLTYGNMEKLSSLLKVQKLPKHGNVLNLMKMKHITPALGKIKYIFIIELC